MINLLPTGVKSELHYARMNTVLRRWAIALGVISLLIGLVTLSGNFYIQYSINKHTEETAKTEQKLQEQKIEEVQKRIADISNNTKLTIQVLSQEILFSKLLTQLASSVPSNAVLLQFQVEELGGALTLLAGATDIDTATQLQVNLSDPQNQIFKQADIENISCEETVDPDNPNPYPCTITIKALFGDNNQFTFIGDSSR